MEISEKNQESWFYNEYQPIIEGFDTFLLKHNNPESLKNNPGYLFFLTSKLTIPEGVFKT